VRLFIIEEMHFSHGNIYKRRFVFLFSVRNALKENAPVETGIVSQNIALKVDLFN